MAACRLCLTVIILIVQTCTVSGQKDNTKSSLTFIIDVNVISQVEEEVNIIVEKYLRWNPLQIQNFVLVTFNDSGAHLQIISKDRNEFKLALAAINVHGAGGGNCPKYAMKGIEIGLTESLPLSYLYVFTDASAKDYARFEEIKSISKKKQSQVFFYLTGERDSESNDAFQVYHRLADASNGLVSHMNDDFRNILKYNDELNKIVTIFNEKFPTGYRNKITVPLDSYLKNILISATGKEPKIEIIRGPDGKKLTTAHVVGTKNLAVVKVKNANPGELKMEVGSKSETQVIITAKSNVNFQFGFSVYEPTSMKDTVTKPESEGNTFLCITLLGDGVKLTKAKILDLNYNVLKEVPLKLVDEKMKFYVSPSFNPPFTIFRVSVSGDDMKTKLPITRIGSTPIVRQDPSTENKEYSAPVIMIDGAPKVIVDYDAPLKLKCSVHSYPAPDVIWAENDTGVRMRSEVQLFKVPSDYVSILNIDKVIKNVTYQCKASNIVGVNIKYIEVETKRKIYFNVIESPKDIKVEYTKGGSIACKIDAYPPALITWYKNGAELSGNTDIDISSDKSVLTIRNMQLDLQGKYTCEAKNNFNRTVFGAKVDIFGVGIRERPVIDKSHKEIRVTEKTNAVLSCSALKGIPKPKIRWWFRPVGDVTFKEMKITNKTVQLNNVSKHQTGSYKCNANNILGSDNFTMTLVVEYPPILKEDVKVIGSKNFNEVKISCDVTGEPAPTVRWFYNGVLSTAKSRIFSDHSLRFKARLNDTGYYKCEAENKLGLTEKSVFLYVFVPVTIKTPKTSTIEGMIGQGTILYCQADGYPKPNIKWTFQSSDATIPPKDVTPAGGEASVALRNMQLDQQGLYTCVAENGIGGSANITYEVKVHVPVTIEMPKNSTIESMVGKSTILYCKADGYPKPNIKWTFQSSNPKIPAKDVTPASGVPMILLRNIQLDQQGLYTCVAENGIGGSANITYDVKVYAPPIIENKYKVKSFEVVEGDLALRIRCQATGSPKPLIVWMKDGLNLAIGSEWIEMEEDGTLIIKNIDHNLQGTYVCLAQNVLGKDTEAYEVIVRDVIPEIPTNTVFVEEGKTIDIKCDVPHKSSDLLRWFKDGSAIARGELTLYSVTRSEDGLYTCRVSDATKSRSATTIVVIGFKPIFTTEEEETVDFVHGADSEILSCEAYGEPMPKSAIWKHNGKTLNTTGMWHPLGMIYGATGTYECEVSNKFGRINRTFTVTSRDCLLDIKKDFLKKQPLMFSPSLKWPVFPVKDEYMIIPHADYFFFRCPSKFSNSDLSPTTSLMAFCERDSTIKINGKLYNFADIQCNEEIKPEVSKSGQSCLPGNTEYVKIGYRVFTTFFEVYEVCLDKENNVPLFTQHVLSPAHTDRSTEAEWSNSLLPQDFDTLYNCRRQTYDIASTLRRGLRTHDSCCFGKRQLVNSHNLLTGVPTSAAYTYLNVIPHWSTCNSKNWEDVELSVRNLVKSTGHDLTVTTGTANPHRVGSSTNITLHDGRGANQTVAPYLWKVVQDRVQAASLAIIQVNIPDLTPEEALHHVLCNDICQSAISWIESSNYRNVEDGFIYCCTITEFEKAFGYNGLFIPDMNYVLFDGNLTPDFYLA